MFSLSDFVAGSVGGAFGLSVAQPFDTVKARLQAGKSTLGKTIIDLYRQEGIYGFYRGYFFPLLTTGLNNSVFFGVYGTCMDWLERGKDFKKKEQEQYRNWSIASAVASFFQVVVACPVDLVKIRQQTDVNPQLRTVDVLREIVIRDGPLGIFRGISPMLWRDVPTGAVYIIVYEKLCEMLSPGPHRGILATCFAGGVAGVCAWMPVLPFDVVQTRMMADNQGKYTSMIHCFRESFKEYGLKGLYKGATLVGVRAFPVNAAIFLGYEQTKYLWNSMLNPT